MEPKLVEQEHERLLIHNAASREYIRHLIQVGDIRGWGTVVAACIPIVLFVLMYATMIWVRPAAEVMQTLIICTFSSFVVIYGFLVSGWYRVTRLGYLPTLSNDIGEASKKRFRDLTDREQGRRKAETSD